MKQVYLSDVSQTPPALPSGAVEGYPQDGTLTGSHQATVPGSYWFYQVSSELENAIRAGGKTPDASKVNQLGEIISTLGTQANAVSYLEQSLTDAQKAQARANIGATAASDVVLTSGAQTVAGIKTWANEIRTAMNGSASHIRLQNTLAVKGELPATQMNWYLPFDGSVIGQHYGAIEAITRTNGENVMRMYCFKNEQGNANSIALGLIYPYEDAPYATAPTTPVNSRSTEIVTANRLLAQGYATGRLASLANAGSYLTDLPGYLDGGGWSSAIQGMAYDKYADVLYTICNYGGQSTFICAFNWATKELIGTNYTSASGHNAFYAGWAHQSLAVYRPTASDPAGYFFAGANTYTAADTQDTSRAFTLNFNRWNYASPATYTTERSWELFNRAAYDVTAGGMNVALSEDGTQLIARAKVISTGIWNFKIWDVKDILNATTGTNIQSLAKQTISSPWGTANIAGQATAFDTTHIYCMYSNGGTGAHQIRVIDRFTGNGVEARPGSYEGFELYGESTTYAEAECLAFVNADGGMHLLMGMQCIGTGDAQPRAIRLYDLQAGSGSIDSGKPAHDGLVAINGSYIGNESSTNGRTTHILRSNRDTKGKSCAYLYRFRNNAAQGSAQNNFFEIDLLENGVRYRGPQLNAHFADGSLTGLAFSPVAVNSCDLGASTAPWVNTYLSASPVIVSDERMKQDIGAWSDEVLDAWAEVDWCGFRMRDAVAKKGEAARIHAGLIAQRIKAVFEKHGLDACRYGLLCHDEWSADAELERKAGDRYSVRYEEALAVEAAYQRRRADRLEARIAAIEEKLNG